MSRRIFDWIEIYYKFLADLRRLFETIPNFNKNLKLNSFVLVLNK